MFFPDQLQIYLCTESIDMRKGYGGLEGLVRDHLGEEPMSGKLFVFRGKRGNSIKIFYWHNNGFAIWSKRLDQGKYNFPREATVNGASVQINKAALRMILDGLELRSAARFA